MKLLWKRKRIMKTTRHLTNTKITSKTLLLAFTVATALISPTIAEEGGVGHYLPGVSATMADRVPDKEGWVIETVYLHYKGNASPSKIFPAAGLIASDINATTDAVLLGGFYTFKQEILGAKYSLGGFLPYVWMDIDAKITLNKNTTSQHDTVNGFGDIVLIPGMMSWKLNECWNMNALLPVYAPTGDYKVGRLANTGLNHWTIDPIIGATYSNDQTGLNFTAFSGIAISSENKDTDYQNGTVFHLDTSVQQLLPVGPGFLGLGLEAFYYQQIDGDRGPGKLLSEFKGMTTGIGPVISYILPIENKTFLAELRWLKELDSTNRVEGDYLWLKLIYQF